MSQLAKQNKRSQSLKYDFKPKKITQELFSSIHLRVNLLSPKFCNLPDANKWSQSIWSFANCYSY